MKRGDVLSVAVQGDYGKPRPAVVVQTDHVQHTYSVLVCLITSEIAPSKAYRVPIPATTATGLERPSEIMADKTLICARAKCGKVFGRASDDVMVELNHALSFILGLAD